MARNFFWGWMCRVFFARIFGEEKKHLRINILRVRICGHAFGWNKRSPCTRSRKWCSQMGVVLSYKPHKWKMNKWGIRWNINYRLLCAESGVAWWLLAPGEIGPRPRWLGWAMGQFEVCQNGMFRAEKRDRGPTSLRQLSLGIKTHSCLRVLQTMEKNPHTSGLLAMPTTGSATSRTSTASRWG